MKKMMLCVALLSGALLAETGPLANGVYAISARKEPTKEQVTRQYQGQDVVLDTAHFAPLVVAGTPQVQRDAKGSGLLIQLAPEAARRLEELTRSHLNERLVVVVADRIVSAPTVRSVIQDGKARITPCEDEACATLLRQLSQ